MKLITVNGVPLSDYRIIIPEGGDIELYLAAQFNRRLSAAGCPTLPVATDRECRSGCEIRIGRTGRTQTVPESGTYKIAVDGTAVEAVCQSYFGAGAMLNGLCGMFGLALDGATALNAGQTVCGEEIVPCDPVERGDLRILYHNILGYQTAEYPAANRGELLLELYKSYRPDVIGLQECSGAFRKDAHRLFEGLKELGYQEICFWPSGKGSYGKGNPMFVDAQKLELLEASYSHAYKSDKGTTLGFFRVKGSERLICITNSHFNANANAPDRTPEQGNELRVLDARNMVHILNQTAERYPDIPMINGGDYNAAEGSDPIRVLTDESLIPIRQTAERSSDYSAYIGYPSYDSEAGEYPLACFHSVPPERSIDHVMLYGDTSKLRVERYLIANDPLTCTLSDHLPHYADISFL